jgi:hypothetical protein
MVWIITLAGFMAPLAKIFKFSGLFICHLFPVFILGFLSLAHTL